MRRLSTGGPGARSTRDQDHRHGRDLLERARELLGDGDPAIRQLAALVSQGERAVLELRDQVERGRATEDYG